MLNINHQQKNIPNYINSNAKSNAKLIKQKQESEQALIEKHSLLQNNVDIPGLFALNLNTKVTLQEQLTRNKNLFAHVLLDNFSKNSDHEGMQAEDSISYMKSLADIYYDKQKAENPTLYNLTEQLNNALIWNKKLTEINKLNNPEERNNIAKAIATEIKALKPGQNFWLSVGYYKEGDGHSMYCQFFKREDGNYDIYI